MVPLCTLPALCEQMITCFTPNPPMIKSNQTITIWTTLAHWLIKLYFNSFIIQSFLSFLIFHDCLAHSYCVFISSIFFLILHSLTVPIIFRIGALLYMPIFVNLNCNWVYNFDCFKFALHWSLHLSSLVLCHFLS